MINKKTLARIKKSLAAGAATLVGEYAAVLLAGGTFAADTVGGMVGFAVAAGWATYAAKNKLGVNELQRQLDVAKAERRP